MKRLQFITINANAIFEKARDEMSVVVQRVGATKLQKNGSYERNTRTFTSKRRECTFTYD